MSGPMEGKCPGCGLWVRIVDGVMRKHSRPGWVAAQCSWGGSVAPETRARQLKLEVTS